MFFVPFKGLFYKISLLSQKKKLTKWCGKTHSENCGIHAITTCSQSFYTVGFVGNSVRRTVIVTFLGWLKYEKRLMTNAVMMTCSRTVLQLLTASFPPFCSAENLPHWDSCGVALACFETKLWADFMKNQVSRKPISRPSSLLRLRMGTCLLESNKTLKIPCNRRSLSRPNSS